MKRRNLSEQVTAMELKVWVEGVPRVVCGLSLDTSCQNVVIALAQSIGQTGRYILILKLHGNERQLVADDCPLQQLAQLGQQAAEAQFILRRTGASLSNGQDTPTSRRRYPLPRASEPEPPKHRESHRVAPGSSTLPRRTKANKTVTSSHRPSPDPRASPVFFLDVPTSVKANPSYLPKEELFRQIRQQQKKLQDLESQLQALERETDMWEREVSSGAAPSLTLDLTQELERLEQQQSQNKAELRHRNLLEEELKEEIDREQGMHSRLLEIQSTVDDYSNQIKDFQAYSAHVEEDIQLRAHALSQALIQQSEEALRPLRQELHNRLQQAAELDASLLESQRELQAAEERLQDRCELIEELNKELRQCDLQQFIQQTSGQHTDPMNPLLVTDAHFGSIGATE